MTTALAIPKVNPTEEFQPFVTDDAALVEYARNVKEIEADLLPCETAFVLKGENIREYREYRNLLGKYQSFDLEGVLNLTKSQKGIQYPVPKFAAFHVNQSDPTHIRIIELQEKIEVRSSTFAYDTIRLRKYEDLCSKVWSRDEIRVMIGVGIVTSIIPCGIHAGCLGYLNWWFLCYLAIGTVLGIVSGLVRSEYQSIYDLRTYFSGVVPSKIRKMINDAALEKEFDKLLLVQEVQEWTINKETISPPVRAWDPLLVGVKAGKAFLLAQFDTTSLEEYVAKEFTS